MKSILIIDDDPGILQIHRMALEGEGYQVFTASDGQEGINVAREKLPDVILSDIHMPGTDGCSVLQAIRADPTLGTKQVVLMTGNPMLVTPRSGMELGADDFLLKPFSLEDLRRCIEARLQRAKIHWRVEDRIIAELRTNLTSTLPHEFFTPLAGVLGLVDMLKHDVQKLTPAEVQDTLCEIERCGWRLQRTIKNFLMTIGEPGLEPPTPTTLDPEVVEDVVLAAAAAVGRRTGRTADIHTRIEPVALTGVAADYLIMAEELISNACSFSRHGTPIDVELARTGVLSVRDRGRGMSSDQIARLGAFQQFGRERHEQQGLGLGLSLVQRLAARHGARLRLESEVDVETTARIEWPLAPAAHP